MLGLILMVAGSSLIEILILSFELLQGWYYDCCWYVCWIRRGLIRLWIQLQVVSLLKMMQVESFSWFKISSVMLLYIQLVPVPIYTFKHAGTWKSFVRMEKETWWCWWLREQKKKWPFYVWHPSWGYLVMHTRSYKIYSNSSASKRKHHPLFESLVTNQSSQSVFTLFLQDK